MANFKVDIEPLRQLQKNLKTDSSIQKIVPDVSIAILEFHTLLDRRVSELFNVPYALNKVRIGRSVAPEQIGNTFLRYSLQYQDKAVPLKDYPIQEVASNSISSAPTRIPAKDGLGFVRWKKGKYSTEYRVAVRKGKAELHKNKKGNYAFRPGSSDILAARKRQTWQTRPSLDRKGIRTKLQLLFGPSVAYLAKKTYEQDPEIQHGLRRMENKIINSFVKAYT